MLPETQVTSLEKAVTLLIASGDPLATITTVELADAVKDVQTACQRHGWFLYAFNAIDGLVQLTGPDLGRNSNKFNDVQALGKFVQEFPAIDREPEAGENPADLPKVPQVLVIQNFHLLFTQYRSLASAYLQKLSETGKSSARCVIGLVPPGVPLPPEISPLLVNIPHDPPSADELRDIAEGVGQGDTTPEELERAIEAARGLTRLQADNVFARSLIRTRKIDPRIVWETKADYLNKDGLVTLMQPKMRYADLGGMLGAKRLITSLLERRPNLPKGVRAKGVLLVGPPGTGKSALAEATGGEVERPVLEVNPSNFFDQYVGNTEKNTRAFFDLVQAMAPVIVFIDEIEKAMAGSADGGHETSRRMLGTFLTKMQNLDEQVFWIFTANDVSGLDAAFVRSERIDTTIYVDLPNREQKDLIWAIYLKKFQGISDPSTILAHVRDHNLDEGWSPADIRACARLSALLGEGIAESGRLIRPTGKAYADRLAAIAEWVKRNPVLDAETGRLCGEVEQEAARKNALSRGTRKVQTLRPEGAKS